MKFGEFVKNIRIEKKNQTLREFCLSNDLDAGNHSKLERGRLAPPSSEEKLIELAETLAIPKDSDDWRMFFDLAAASRGQFPRDLLNDQEVLDKLPVLFSTLRGQRVPSEKLKELVNFVRRGE
jgi:transcriptional regulator with XRE-family HTH domain